ncbi:MAG: hypothetical protein FD144_2812, partial [Rhodospirillaceae bacterium]
MIGKALIAAIACSVMVGGACAQSRGGGGASSGGMST